MISIVDESPTFSSMVATYAYQHLQQRAREVGGQNRGPWVRLYLRNHQRPLDPKLPQSEFAWCAGFASTLLEQTEETLGRPSPLEYDWNCTALGTVARRKRLFVSGADAHKDPSRIPAGSLFLIRKKRRGHYHHTGVVVQADEHHVRTIEGNTSGPDDIVPRGHEVAMHTRDYGTLDFIVLKEK
ncbi:MAG: CHAP domain-containing protein [Acidobacteriota bacterium]|nr:CHAP domain-containing protein [Acidobacteriota bacterium]